MAKKNKAKKEAKKKAQKGNGDGPGEMPEGHVPSSSSQVQSPSLGPEKGPAFTEMEEAISVLPDDSTEKVPETAVIDLDADQSPPLEESAPQPGESSDMIQQENGTEEAEPAPTITEDADPAKPETLPDPAPETAPQVTDEVVDDAEWEKDVAELEKLLEEINAPQEPAEDAMENDAAEEPTPEKDLPEEEPVDLVQEEKEDEPEVAAEVPEEEAPAHVDDDDAAPEKPSDDSHPDGPVEVPAETAAEEEPVEGQRDLPEENPATADYAEEEHIPEEREEPDTRSVASGKISRYPTHPPAPMPLPSPVPSEPRSIHSPVPDHPLSRHGSPLTYHVSPPYRYATPHIHPYSPHMMAMPGPPPPMHPGSVAPSSASFATAYHSPIMDHASMPPPFGYPRRPSGLSNGGFYNGKMDRTQSGGSGHSHHHRTEKANGGPAPDEKNHEHHHLMGRIEKAMPDISRLMDSFKDTQGKLQAREAESRQLQSQHEQAIMHKDFYIEALQGQMRKAATETAEEYTKLKNVISELRLELGNQQEKVKDLEECLAMSRKEKEELESVKAGIETEIQGLQKKIDELQLEHERAVEESKEHERTELSLQKEELTNLFEEIRAEDENAANDRYNEREKELIDEKEALKSAWEEEKRQLEEAQAALKTELESAQNDLQESREDAVAKTEILEAKEKELESTKTELESRLEEMQGAQGELTSTKTKLENNQVELESTQAELNSTLEELTAKQLELEKGHKEFQENHANHTAEREKLTAFHAAQVEALHGTHSTQLGDLRNTHETNLKEAEDRCKAFIAQLEEKEKAWATEKSELEKQLTEKTDELTGLEREREALERGDIAREKYLQSAVDEMRRTIDNMENDREKLRKTLQSLGEATDLKTSKGDQFFMESFGQLRKLIVELSKEHFSYLPIDPPKDILEKIPPEMPSFLDNTPAARELRAAYIQHVVSKTLTYRVFQPFLFTLGRRYDKADTFFQVLSMDIRRKSVRREAFWRQQTLKAAYTTSDAKQSINVVAAVIVDEIVDHIKHFADPKQLDALLNGVRRIVKIAAETWRHARVERELVLATMPAPESEGVSNEEWEEYTCGRRAGDLVSGATTSSPSPSSPPRSVLLRVFPRIYREAAHEDFADDKEKFNACVYFPGTIMYSDSPSVLARREELGRKSPIGHGVNGEQ